MRLLVMGIYANFFDEEQQVNGSIIMQDSAGITMKHQGYFSIDEVKKSLKLWQVYYRISSFKVCG